VTHYWCMKCSTQNYNCTCFMPGNWSVAQKKEQWEDIWEKLLKGLCGPKNEGITEGTANCMMKIFILPIFCQLLLLDFPYRRISIKYICFSFSYQQCYNRASAFPWAWEQLSPWGLIVPYQRFQSQFPTNDAFSPCVIGIVCTSFPRALGFPISQRMRWNTSHNKQWSLF